MEQRILLTIDNDEIAPRFDMTPEVLLLTVSENRDILARKSLLLAHASGDEVCDLALARDIHALVCGGIEDEYYHYLRWKRIEVIDFVAGPVDAVVSALCAGMLRSGLILFERATA